MNIDQSSELNYLRKELRYIKNKTLVVIIASTWLVYIGMSTLTQFDIPYKYGAVIAIPVLINAMIWVFWGMSSYLNSMGFGIHRMEMDKFDVTDEDYLIDALRYTLHKQQRKSLAIEFFAALQFAIMSAIWVLSLVPRLV
ncbi:MAG: hypothetical protein ACJASL_001600 [Paraglaciecola sp.]